jgi:preprotein translocase subunit SecE
MANPTSKKNNSRFGFISETVAELKKVSWLSRREAFYLTGLVLIVAITVGAILGAIDFGFSFLVDELIIGE